VPLTVDEKSQRTQLERRDWGMAVAVAWPMFPVPRTCGLLRRWVFRVAVLALPIVPAIAAGRLGDSALPVELERASIGCLWSFDGEGSSAVWQASDAIGEMLESGGRLSIRTVGADPHLTSPTIAVAAQTHPYFAMRCRSNVDGISQIYFSTSSAPGFRDTQMIPLRMSGDSREHVYEIDLRQIPNWNGTIDGLRIDPVNGPAEASAEVAIDWIALYLAPARPVPQLPSWVDERTLRVGFDNQGGCGTQVPMELRFETTAIATLPVLGPSESREATLDVSAFPAHFSIDAWLGDQHVWRGRFVRPLTDFHHPAELDSTGHDVEATTLSISSGRGMLQRSPQMQVVLGPLASVTTRAENHVWTYCEFDPKLVSGDRGEGLYEERIMDPVIGDLTCTMRVRGTRIESTLRASSASNVVRFEGPRMLQERPFSHALFPGLEYLEAGEESSSSRFTGTTYAKRTTPALCKITAPMIAVEYDRPSTSTGVPSDMAKKAGSWVAALVWSLPGLVDDTAQIPVAEFQSQTGALRYGTTWVPGRDLFDDSDARYAREAWKMVPGQSLQTVADFAISPGTIEDFFAAYWLSRIPPAVRIAASPAPESPMRVSPVIEASFRDHVTGLESILATSMSAYTTTLFDGTVPGWKRHIAIGEPHTDHPEIRSLIIAESIRSQNPRYAQAVECDADAQIEAYLGTAEAEIDATHRARACEAIARMGNDGSFGYAPSPEMQAKIQEQAKIHGVVATTLGEKGITNCGLIAEQLIPLAEYAACSRDPIFVLAAIRALSRLNQFTVPRGSQSWEVHVETPDIYTAAICAQANLWGWRLTGHEAYLDEAERWLKTGLPFLYWWNPVQQRRVAAVNVANGWGEGKVLKPRNASLFYSDSEREILPFASIPAFGTSWYGVQWFGVPVQWCGLAWANAVREIDAVRPLPAMVTVADGVFASAVNQQCDRGYLAGTIPDSWDLSTGLSQQPFIIPSRLVEYAYFQLDSPRVESMQYSSIAGSRWTHVASRSTLSNPRKLESGFSIDARFLRDQNASVIIGGTAGPLPSVRVNGRLLLEGLGVGSIHWTPCGGERGVLVVRWIGTGRADHIEVLEADLEK